MSRNNAFIFSETQFWLIIITTYNKIGMYKLYCTLIKWFYNGFISQNFIAVFSKVAF